MITRVYNPEGKLLTIRQIRDWCIKVHEQGGAKTHPMLCNPYFWKDRLKGHHCNCGVNEEGFSKGEFVLLPLNDEAVIEGGKPYMRCKKCDCISHL